MITIQPQTNEQIEKAKELISNLSTSRHESMVYQVDVCLKEVQTINFSNEYDSMTFCERLCRAGIPHCLRVINLNLHCYE